MSRQHGTRTKYVHDGCRCFPCRLANADYATALERRKQAPYYHRCVAEGKLWIVYSRTDGEVFRSRDPEEALAVLARFLEDFDPSMRGPFATDQLVDDVRRHLAYLRQHGVGLRQVARTAKVSRSRLTTLVNGQTSPGGRPHRRLRKTTADRILAVTIDAAAGGAIVDARAAWELVKCLKRAGIPKYRIAHAIGQTTSSGLQIGTERILRSTHDRIVLLHDELWRAEPRVRAACRCVRLEVSA